MKTIIIIVMLMNVGLAIHAQNLEVSQSNREELFNGKNLEGWYQIVDGNGTDKNLFKTEGGTIHAYSDQAENSIQSFGALITDKEFENYVLSLEYKWGDKKFKPRENSVRDAGVLIHMYGESVIWPAGIECQVQEGDTGDLWIIKSRASSKVDPAIRAYDENGLVNTLGAKGMDYNRFPRSYCWEKPGWNGVCSGRPASPTGGTPHANGRRKRRDAEAESRAEPQGAGPRAGRHSPPPAGHLV